MDKKIPTIFEAIPQGDFEQVTPLISKGRVSIFYKYKNRNRAYITDDFADKLISTLPYVPVVGIYDKDKEDFTSHNRDRNVARIYGLVPENPNGEWVTKVDPDGVERTYYVVDVYLYTGRLEDANKIIGNPQSLELDRDSIKGAWIPMDDGTEYFVYTDAYFIGLSALGKDVEPCFEGAAFFDLLTQFGEFFSKAENIKSEQENDCFNEGGLEMDLTNFKFSSDELKNNIWRMVNPNFSAEGNWKIDKVVCEVGTDYALVTYVEESKYERYSFKTNEDGTIEMIGEPEVVYNTWVRQEDVKDYEELKANYSSCKEILDKFSTLNETISEKDAKILELENDKSTYELEANNAKEEIDSLRADYEVLKNEHDNRIALEKENKINEYKELVSEAALAKITENMANFTIEELEKELLFEMKKEKPTMFSKELTTSRAPISMVNDTSANGIVSILEKYRNN